MSIASRITSIEGHIGNAYDSIKKFGVDTSVINKNIENIANVINDEIYNKLPKITQSGTGFTLENVQNGQVDDFKMIGTDLYQNTTKGINLFNFGIRSRSQNGITTNYNLSEAIINGTTTNANSIMGFATRTSGYSVKIGTYPAGSYVFKFEKVSGNLAYSSGDSEIHIRNSNDTTIFKNKVNSETTNYTKSFTLEQETELFIQWYVNTANWIFTDYTCRFMITSGIETDYDFEPYTGGIASPNPNYPQEINVVEGRQVITDKGKNLFYLNNNYQANYDDATINRIDNNSFVLSMNKNKTAKQSPCATIEFDANYLKPNTSYTISKKNSDTGYSLTHVGSIRLYINESYGDFVDADEYTFTTPSQITSFKILLYLFFDNTTVGNYEIEFYDIQLEENSSATDYEPYYEPVSYNIDLQLANIYLAKIPNTDYKNRIYKNNGNWYYDESVKKVVLDGSEEWVNWTAQELTNTILVGTKIIDNISNVGYLGMSNCFENSSTAIWTTDVQKMQINSTGENKIRFRINKTIANNYTNFKTWLSTHNVIVWYPLATSVTTQITNTTLINQLEAISTFKGTNIFTISNDNNVIPEIEITRLKELEKLA